MLLTETLSFEDWLKAKISEETGLPMEEISGDENFDSFNLDSLSIISISYDLETSFNLEGLNPMIFNEYSSINALSEWLRNR